MERIYTKIKENWNIYREMLFFYKYFKNPVIVILPNWKAGNAREGLGMRLSEESEIFHSEEIFAKVLDCLKRGKMRKSFEQFQYGDKMFGLCYPLVTEDSILGFVILYGLKKKVSPDLQKKFTVFADMIVQKSLREIELEDMNESVKPRAIALSTVHTVHRLMTSTLDLGELLPRIARLSLQIIRANRCSIKLVDKKRKILLPKTTIDLRKKKTKLKRVQIGKYAPGRAVKKEVSIRSDNYLAVPMIDENVMGVITLYDKLEGGGFTRHDEEIMKTLCEQAAIAVKNAQLFKEQEDLTLSSIKCIAQLLANRPYCEHKAETSFLKIIKIMGPKLNMNTSEIKMLQYAVMLHDAGQIGIPEKVLMKRGELTGSEYDIVKTHPLKGAAILSKFKPLKPIVPIILYHHENFNGTGYPKGLKKTEIPLAARALAVVGVFEAMVTEKPYRKAFSVSAAIKEIRKNAGTQFDPHVVEVFCEAVYKKKIRKLLRKELGQI